MNNRLSVWSTVAVLLVLWSQMVFVVMPDQVGLIVHLGDMATDASGELYVYNSGVHWKRPFVDRVLKIDRRLQSFEVPSSRVLTQDQKSVFVDYYVKWYVKDIGLFYKRTGGDYVYTRELVRRKIADSLRAEFGSRNLSEIISGEERNEIVDIMQKAGGDSVASLGLGITDVRLKRVDYPQEVTRSVYERMKSSRHRDAERYRAEGNAQSERIKSEADREASVIIAESKKKAAKMVAEASREAMHIYNQSYSQAPEFYAFYLKMKGYNKNIHDGELMLISPEKNQYYADMYR